MGLNLVLITPKIKYSILRDRVPPLKKLFSLIDCLSNNDFVSGEVLSHQFSVSRTTISTWIAELESYGLTVHRVKGKGYRLIDRLQLLDKAVIHKGLSAELLDSISVIDIAAESASTNQTAMKANYFDEKWKLFASEYQHTGRGRRGRQWVSPIGTNLLFSLARKAVWPPNVLYGASILTGIAVAEALQKYIHVPAKIKWPNDIYLEDAKAAGILCEMQGSPTDEALLVVGVGINVFSSPVLNEKATTNLGRYSLGKLDRNFLLIDLVASIINSIMQAVGNSANCYSKWVDYDYLYMKSVEIHQGQAITSGIANGIDDRGQLKLVLFSGEEQVFNGGEVSVRW
ncbi:MAG: biotin--[acetyl-CoA-carboxylase] ligase [Reinekea sp.]|jgi:BirA family transcriptional regulator, biotin operon repressor / biotin---[acetyl-CoA-carboxylase] ligase